MQYFGLSTVCLKIEVYLSILGFTAPANLVGWWFFEMIRLLLVSLSW